MKKYTKPELNIEKFNINDIITVSEAGTTTELTVWGTNVKIVNPDEVIDIYK